MAHPGSNKTRRLPTLAASMPSRSLSSVTDAASRDNLIVVVVLGSAVGDCGGGIVRPDGEVLLAFGAAAAAFAGAANPRATRFDTRAPARRPSLLSIV